MQKGLKWVNSHLVCLFALLFLVPAASSAQFLNWSYYNILDESRESGARPDMAIDASGTVHMVYWHAQEDKAIYAYKPIGGSWQKEYIDASRSNGFVSELTLDASGTPHVVFMENANQIAQYNYAYRTGPNSWVIDPIPGAPATGWGAYGPNASVNVTNRIQHSADIIIKFDGTPEIVFFDGWTDPAGWPNCTPSTNYDFRLVQATKFFNQWYVNDFGEIPDINESCGTTMNALDLPTGDRYGEFPTLVQRADSTLDVFCHSKFNNQLIRFQSQQSDTVWAKTELDSLANRLDYASWGWADRFYTFHGISSFLDHDDNVHLAFGTSFEYGDNFFGLTSTNELVYSRIVNADSVYNYSFGVSGDYTYRNYVDLATLGADSIFLVYADLNSGQLLMYESFDSGQTWVQDTIGDMLIGSQCPIRVYGDSIFVAFHNPQRDNLNLAKRAISGGNWLFEDITLSQNHGQSFDGMVTEELNDTIGRIAFNDSYSGKLFYGIGSIGNGWNYAIEELSGAGGNASAVALATDSNTEPYISYSGGGQGYPNLAFKSGLNWQYEVVDSSAYATFTDLAISPLDTIHLVYYDENRKCLSHRSRHINEVTWRADSVDCDTLPIGKWPSLALEGEIPHVAYHDEAGLQLKYARRNPSTRIWETDTVLTGAASAVGKFNSLKLTSTGLPKIAFLDEQQTRVLLAEKELSGTWTISEVDTAQVSNIGRPTELVIDKFDNVWVALNYNFNFDRVKLMHRDTSWQEVSVNSTGQIADEFHFEIIDGDLFILGKKTELNNTGLAMLHAPRGLYVYRDNELDLSNFIESIIYPNPFSESSNLRLTLQRPETLSVDLYDLHGRRISSLLSNKKLGAGVHSFELNRGSMAPGIYLAVIANGKSQMVQKLVVGN